MKAYVQQTRPFSMNPFPSTGFRAFSMQLGPCEPSCIRSDLPGLHFVSILLPMASHTLNHHPATPAPMDSASPARPRKRNVRSWCGPHGLLPRFRTSVPGSAEMNPGEMDLRRERWGTRPLEMEAQVVLPRRGPTKRNGKPRPFPSDQAAERSCCRRVLR